MFDYCSLAVPTGVYFWSAAFAMWIVPIVLANKVVKIFDEKVYQLPPGFSMGHDRSYNRTRAQMYLAALGCRWINRGRFPDVDLRTIAPKKLTVFAIVYFWVLMGIVIDILIAVLGVVNCPNGPALP